VTGDQVWGLSGAVVSYFSIFGGKEQGVMVSLETPVCEFDAAVPDFELADVDGVLWTPERLRGEKGLLVMFICNHCPYVKAIRERLVRDLSWRMLMEFYGHQRGSGGRRGCW